MSAELELGGTDATDEEAAAMLRILFAGKMGDSVRALRSYGDSRVAPLAESLREARAWIDKHRCCTEERTALVARIDKATRGAL